MLLLPMTSIQSQGSDKGISSYSMLTSKGEKFEYIRLPCGQNTTDTTQSTFSALYLRSLIATSDGHILANAEGNEVSLESERSIKTIRVVMKLDREFNTIWCKELGPYDYVDVLFETSNGHYLGAGRHYLVLLDLNGNVEWERNYGANNGTMPRFSRDIVEVGNDQFIVAGDAPPTHFVRGDCEGNSCFDSYDSSDLFNIKIDIQGNLIWENYIEYEWAEYANAIAPTPDGGFIIAGTMENPVGDGELYYVKADSVGNEVWSKALGGWDDWDHYYYSANAIIPTNDGCYVMSGKLNDCGFNF